MMQLAANLSMLFGDAPFLERFARAAAAGFKGVEYLFPYEHAAVEIAERLRSHNLTQVLFNAPPGDWAAGSRGLAALVGQESAFRESLEQMLPYVDATGVRHIHVMAGIVSPEDAEARTTYLRNLEYAARLFAPHGITVLIEPLNTRDMPGYFLSSFDTAIDIIRTLDIENVKLQFDVYHRQILRGDVTVGIRELFEWIGHIQIAGVPQRNEPDRGELSLDHLFTVLRSLKYTGWIGCEYNPEGRTEDGLAWTHGR